MTRFQKIQKISSIIPFLSTVFVAFVTMFELKRRMASKKIWFYFILTFCLSGIAVYLLNTVIMTGEHPLLNVIATGLVLAVANILFVDYQVMSTQTQQPKAKSNYQTGIVICCVATVVISIVVLFIILLSPSMDIEDVNGNEKTNLAVIEADEIISGSDHFSAFSSYTSQSGSRTNVTGNLKNYDYQECAFKCQKISGIMTLQVTKTTCEQLTLEISSELEEGNMEIVIIIDGEYYAYVPVNQNSTIKLSDIAGKTVIVRMAAESAKLSVSVKRFEE